MEVKILYKPKTHDVMFKDVPIMTAFQDLNYRFWLKVDVPLRVCLGKLHGEQQITDPDWPVRLVVITEIHVE